MIEIDDDTPPDIVVIKEADPPDTVVIRGDEVVEVIVITEAPPGPKGDKGDRGDPGDNAPLDIPFTVADTNWHYIHNLGRLPLYRLYDSNGIEITADVSSTTTTINVSFGNPQTGHLILL